jgi:excisionase family DNA binding protein
VSAGFGGWLRRQREGHGWSRREPVVRIAGAAGSAVTAPVPALESYISRWEAGNVAISARYRQLLDAVLGPAAEVSAPQPPSGPAPDPRKWVRARPGGQLSARTVLAQRYGLPADAVMRAQDELLSTGILSRGQVYGTLHVSQAKDWQAPRAPLPAAPGPADPGRRTTAIPPDRAGGGRTATAPPAARNPRAYARPGAWVPAADAGTGPGPGEAPARSPVAPGEPPPAEGLPEFLLVKECAAQARVSPRTIYSLVRHGHVEAVRVGHDIRIYARSWHAYLQAPRPGPRPAHKPGEDGQRDDPPAADTPAAGPRPGPAQLRRGSAAGRVPRSQMSSQPWPRLRP